LPEEQAMENRFDELAKTLAEPMPRRQAFRKIGGIVAGATLAFFGLGKTTAQAATLAECQRACAKVTNRNAKILCIQACLATPVCAGKGQSCETKPCCPGLNCDGICFGN